MTSKTLFEVQMKGLIEVLTQQTREVFSVTQFRTQVEDALSDEYTRGIDFIDREVKPPVNTVLPNNVTKQLEGLYNYVEQNLQDQVDEVGKRLRQEMQRGLQNKESKAQIIERVKRVFREDGDVINRLKMVIRTEVNRANNTGRLEAANQAEEAGIKLLKWLDVVHYQPGRSSAFCNTPAGSGGGNSANGKYGDKKKAIPVDQNFIVRDKNKTVRALNPPFHPNCRTVLRVIRKEEKQTHDSRS